jgi:hypothetical protein
MQSNERLPKKEYAELMQARRRERNRANLDKCFDYAPRHLTKKERLTKAEFLRRKKVFWATHLKDVFSTYASYSSFVGINKLGWFDEGEIRRCKKEALVNKKNYGVRLGKKKS